MKTSDDAFIAFNALRQEFSTFDFSSHTESDTRARVISRILHDVLNWPQSNVKREQFAAPGFMDYVLLTNRPLAVIEAKKSDDTFSLPPDITTARAFTLGGILRTVKNLQQYIDQACDYCWRNGIEYAIITNGSQWICFRASRVDGIQLGNSRAIVFNGLNDIERRFIDFWTLLEKRQADNNSFARVFQPLDHSSSNYQRITDTFRTHQDSVSRNVLSGDLDPLINEYMGEITADESNNKLRQLFVTSQTLDKVLETVEHHLSMTLSATLLDSGLIIEHQDTQGVSTGITQRLHKHLVLPPRGEVLLLLGRVGSGKTTFVHHFLRIDLKALLDKHLFVPLDFRLLEPGAEVRAFFYTRLHSVLADNTIYKSLTSPELRTIYAPEIREITAGPLAVLERQNKKLYEEKIADVLLAKYNDREAHLKRTVRYLAAKRGVRCVLLFDNVDQLDFNLQQEIFTFAHSVSESFDAFSLLPMWEETYFRSSRSGKLATYHRNAHTLPSVSVVEIINRRLEFIVSEIERGGVARQLLTNEASAENVVSFLRLVRESIMHDGKRVRVLLEALAMGNLRNAMLMFQQFLVSGHTDTGKVLAVAKEASLYSIPVHEFIKSIGLGESRYYHSDRSPIVNLFTLSDELRPSHLTKLRLLEYLIFNRNRTSTYGVGFVSMEVLRRDFARIGTSDTDIDESLKALSSFSTVQNEVYDASVVGRAYRVTPAGRYYSRDLAGRFAYLDLMLQDTPIADPVVFAKMLALVHRVDLEERFARVHHFVEYLAEEEAREHAAILHTSDSPPLKRRIAQALLQEFERDRDYIRKRVSKRRNRSVAAENRTPYNIK